MIRFLRYSYILIWATTLSGMAQSVSEDSKYPAVKAIARAYPDSIVVRWSVDQPVAWQLTNKYGYLMERYVLFRDGKRLANPEKEIRISTPMTPRPLDEWETLAERDDYALIAAQAIYGETFELSENYATDIVQIINKSKELEQRFSFALFAADMSPATAKASGIWFTDYDVAPNEKYVYKIYAHVPPSLQQIDTGYVYAGVADHSALPKPVDFEAIFEDKKVLLSWDQSYYDNLYVAYRPERSTDGQHFTPISSLPVTTAASGTPSRLMFMSDSLPENYTRYHYRVKGLTPFGETGPPSDTVSGFGFRALAAAPAITAADVVDNEKIVLQWQFDDTNTSISRFTLSRATSADGTYTVIQRNLNPGTRSATDATPQTVNYYKLTAEDDYGQKRSSFPYLAQLIDSIPPAPPLQLQGTADTTGLVTISWRPNSEKDVKGYRVYRKNNKTDPWKEVTADAIDSTIFIDQMEPGTLTTSIYYCIAAVDHHYNSSPYSSPLTVKRPDNLPPVAPTFKDITSVPEGLAISWVNSSSVDVTRHLLYRRIYNERGWKLIGAFQTYSTDTTIIDTTIDPEVYYEYTLLAVDENKLESTPAVSVKVEWVDSGGKAITVAYAKINRDKGAIQLTWEYDQPDVQRIELFKRINDETPRIYQSLEKQARSFTDDQVSVGEEYQYSFRVVFEDGSVSAFSEPLTLRY